MMALLFGAFVAPLAKAAAGDPALLARIAAAAKDGDLPDAVARPVLVGGLRPVAQGSALRLVSLELGYEGLGNRYCRLVLDDGDAASLVPLPPAALHDACQRVKTVVFGDFNGDGLVDVIHGLVVPSQAGALVQEAVVYLSRTGIDAAQRPSYCYAAALSGQLAPQDLVSRQSAGRAVARIRDRSGPQVLTCQP